ncbi:IS3 family transposase [Paenibacillus larvae]|nr:IS3 family transposase [Paenibacillus larvae]MDT2292478.1 IS3 family transposase [Paenibacillus larvae]
MHVNHKRVYRLMKQMGIQAQIRKEEFIMKKEYAIVVSDNDKAEISIQSGQMKNGSPILLTFRFI